MTTPLLLALFAVTLLVLALAFVREIRRALQRLLAHLLSRWRTLHDEGPAGVLSAGRS